VEHYDIFRDIAERTGGDIYIGVVGPVRTGKSTFIKKFMQLVVIPSIDDPAEKERALDELPQSGAGRTVMTVEPKFIPENGVEITPRENVHMRVRLVDCVGYAVPGALGYEDENGPRMVLTPWFDHEIPFEEAAEVGTKKVLTDHSTIGVVVTTDGTITEIGRESYAGPEDRVIEEIEDLGKPYVIVLNTTQPDAEDTLALAQELENKHGVPVIPCNCAQMTEDDIHVILEQVLFEFPVKEVKVNLPGWVDALEGTHWLKGQFEGAIEETVRNIHRLRDVDGALADLGAYDFIVNVNLEDMDMGSGVAVIELGAPEELFYKVLADTSGYEIKGKGELMALWKGLVSAKKEFDHFSKAVEDVKRTGYGIVPPRSEEINFEDPELVKQGNQFGVRLSASAPSIHLLRADVQSEITPIIGSAKQGEEMVKFLMRQFEDDPKKIWKSDLFGRTLDDVLTESIQNKMYGMPENAQVKLQQTVQRITNEGSGGLICIII